LTDKYSERYCRESRNVRSQSVEEECSRGTEEVGAGSEVGAFRSLSWPVDDSAVKNCATVMPDRNVCTQQANTSQSIEEHHEGSGERNAGCRVDTSRLLSCPEDTAVKNYSTATSNSVHLQRDTSQIDSQHLGRMSGIMEQNGRPAAVSSSRRPVAHDDSGSDNLSEVECASAVETDGLEPDTSSSKPPKPVAVLSPTTASSANDSGYVEQDGRLSPLILSVKSMRIASDATAGYSSDSTAWTHRRPADNDSSAVTLRNYQKELAEPGCQGSNCIICAPTGSGKTYTAGYICKTRRDVSISQGQRFKCLFVVCIRNLIIQQRDALRDIMPDSVVCGMDEKLILSEYFRQFDVVVATAQVCSS